MKASYEGAENTMNKGMRIKKRRLELGLNQAELGKLIGKSKTTISEIEKGERGIDTDLLPLIAEALQTSAQTLMGWDDDIGSIASISNIIPMPSFRSIPLLGDIACGDPITADSNINGYIPLPDYVHADFCLTCKGDSMINARIYDGDIVFIRHQPTVEDGEIAAVRIGSEATLKRVKKYSKMIVLKPENPAYPDIELNGNDEIEIIGKAVHFLSAVK